VGVGAGPGWRSMNRIILFSPTLFYRLVYMDLTRCQGELRLSLRKPLYLSGAECLIYLIRHGSSLTYQRVIASQLPVTLVTGRIEA
jgi:hypothetical protein